MIHLNGKQITTTQELEEEIVDCLEETKTVLRNEFNGTQNQPHQPSRAKIFRYVCDENISLAPTAIDHNTMLKTSLKIVEVLGTGVTDRGLLIEKNYFNIDDELIFRIMYEYERNEFGQYTGQRLELEWFGEDGSVVAYKDKGMEVLTSKRSKEIVKNRRKSIANMLENNVEDLLLASGAGNAGLALGRALLAEIAPLVQTFVESGVAAGVINFVSDPAKQAAYPFLLAEIDPGVNIIAYIADFMSFT